MRSDANELEEHSTGTVNPAALRHKLKLRPMRLGAVQPPEDRIEERICYAVC